MLRVIESHRFEELASALAEQLAPLASPFAPPRVAIPSRAVGRWVQYALATRAGVAAGYQTSFLERLLAEELTADHPELRPLDKAGLEAALASVLADRAVLDQPALTPALAYLDGDGPDGVGPRRVQLAAELAERTWEYALTRPEWLQTWQRGHGLPPEQVLDPTVARWHGALWHATCRHLAEVAGPHPVPVPELAMARRRARWPAPPGPPIFVIGLSFVPRVYLDALAYLAEVRPVTVLAMSPCAMYWGDVARPRRRRAAGLAAVAPDEPLALQRWGSPGRDTLAALAELSEGDIDDRFGDSGALEPDASARARWAHDTLLRAAPPAAETAATTATAAPAAGVQILACPSPVRELEVVAAAIRARLERDPSLTANQIAVLLAPSAVETYLPQIAPAFARYQLPFHVVDMPALGHGHAAVAMELLLALPLGRFRRPELLGVMTHPAVTARHPGVDPHDWMAWTEALGIVHGADDADHAGTYLAGMDTFHWDQGIKRLALGAFMAGPRAGADLVATLEGRAYRPEEVAADEQASAATFALLARSLIADARWLRGHRAPLATWAGILDDLAAAYLGGKDEAAQGELTRVRGALADLAELDLDGRVLDYPEVAALARRRLGQVRADRGEPLAYGVHVARITPHRPLPFAHVFAVGLGEGSFPSSDRRAGLELRATLERGDVSARDRDRYAFLELTLAARDELVLSYVDREPVTGEPRAPASVVHELAEMLAPYLGVAPTAALGALTVKAPLHRFDDDGDPLAARERYAAALRRDLDAAARERDQRVPPPRALTRALAARPELARALGLGHGALTPVVDDGPLVVRLTHLRAFLESAPQGWAKAVLSLYDDDDDERLDHDEEPLAVDAMTRANLTRAAFARYLASGELADAVTATWKDARLTGQAPVGVFGEVAEAGDRELLARWAADLDAAGGRGQRFRRYGLGRAPHGADGVTLAPVSLTITLDGRPRRVDLVGECNPAGDACGTLLLTPSKASERIKLRAALDHVVLAAAGVATTGWRHLILAKEKPDRAAHAPWSADEARGYLAALCAELYGGSHDYLLSLDMAVAVLGGKEAKPDRPKDGRPGSLGYGPLRDRPDRAMVADLDAVVARRYQPLFGRLGGLR
ncbi:MAG: exodeoxyribonuclease V subunit gamma [Myxococcales bacterium]|nr:exodeoxyribonuclease V subunit gamma [Myxococcales bacterium]